MLKKSYSLNDFCQKTINNVLNRLGYTLKKVLKTKPLKKIPETDAIFDNVNKQHQLAKSNPRILRATMDVKAKVKVGNLSRNGYSRTLNPPITDDHDHKLTDVLVPFGLHEINTNNTFLIFGNSKETPDFIVDCIELWWSERQFMADEYDLLMIDLDNGKSVAGNTKQFLKRIVEFSKKIALPIQLVYYPPYHSKYNPVERTWGILENHWNGALLTDRTTAIAWAKTMTWKGIAPIIQVLDQVYETGVKVAKKAFRTFEERLCRNKQLPKWDVIIKPAST